MIVALSNQAGPVANGLLAKNLAVLRARGGRPVLLVDGRPGQPACQWSAQRHAAGTRPPVRAVALARTRAAPLSSAAATWRADGADVLLVTDERDPAQCRAAYGAASLAVLTVPVDWGLEPAHAALLDCLAQAHSLNPALRVLFVAVDGDGAPSPHQLERLRARVARVPAATLAACSVPLPADFEYGKGRCVCDAETCDPDIAAALHSLYAEVY